MNCGKKTGRKKGFRNKGKEKLRKVGLNLITVIVLSALIFFVFRKDYQAIWECIRHVPVLGVFLILFVDFGYQLIGSYG